MLPLPLPLLPKLLLPPLPLPSLPPPLFVIMLWPHAPTIGRGRAEPGAQAAAQSPEGPAAALAAALGWWRRPWLPRWVLAQMAAGAPSRGR
jgi:hypothetical protein